MSVNDCKTIRSGLKKRARSRDLYNYFVVSVPTLRRCLRVCLNVPISLMSFLAMFSLSVVDKKIEENNKLAKTVTCLMKTSLSESLQKFSNLFSRQSISKHKHNSQKSFRLSSRRLKRHYPKSKIKTMKRLKKKSYLVRPSDQSLELLIRQKPVIDSRCSNNREFRLNTYSSVSKISLGMS